MSEPLHDNHSSPDTAATDDATARKQPYGTGTPAYGTPPWPNDGAPDHSAPGSGTPSDGPGTGPGYGGLPMTVVEERHWATAAHLSSFIAAYVALGFLGPLVVLLAAGSRSPFVRRHAVEALNFNLSVLLYIVISAILVLLLIGIPMLIAIGLLYLVTTIQGALAASRGEEYRYPLTIRLVS